MQTIVLLSSLAVAVRLNAFPSVPPIPVAQPPFLLAQSIWKPFSSTQGRFSILLPGTPQQNKQALKTSFGTVDLYRFSVVRTNEATYLAAYCNIPTAVPLKTTNNINNVFTSVRDAYLRSAQGKLVSQQRVGLYNYPGRQFRLQFPKGVTGRGRMFLANRRLYLLVVQTNKERYLTRSIEGFLNSFRVIQPPRGT